MRVSSLSDDRVLGLLSRYFIPCWASRDAYQLEASRAEQEELLRIDRSRLRQKLEGGNVCVYILAPDGEVAATLPVQRAYRPENLLPFLEKLIKDQGIQPRSPETIRATRTPPREAARPHSDGGLLLHVFTRLEDAGPNRGVSQDWVDLTAVEWLAFVPPPDARPETAWKVSPTIANKLYQCFYPPGPHWSSADSKVASGNLTARVVSVTAQKIIVKLTGSLELIYPARGLKADGRVTARVVGVIHCDPARKVITNFSLVSEEAEHVWYWQGKPQPRKMAVAVENAQ
jgi:hypothetical protein